MSPFAPTARCPRAATLATLLLAGCSPGAGPVSPQRAAAHVPADAVWTGEIVLHAGSPGPRSGAVTLAIVPPGGEEPVLARSWDLGDPAWRRGSDGWRLYFALDARDAWPGARGAVAEAMDLTARYDPDGNPATEEAGVARARQAVRKGARDLAVEIAVPAQVAVHDASGGG